MNTMKTTVLLNLLLLAGCGGFTSERPSEKDLKTSLATFTPSYWNIGKFKTETYENLGTKTLPKIATRFKSEARVNSDLFIIANAPSDIPKEYLNDAVFLKPTVKNGETREVFGVALSERLGDSWKTDFGLESANLEDFGKPKSSYERPGSLTIVIGSNDEIALRDSIEEKRKREAERAALERKKKIDRIVSTLKAGPVFRGSSSQRGWTNPLVVNAELHWDQSTELVNGWIEWPDYKIKKQLEGRFVEDNDGNPVLQLRDTAVIEDAKGISLVGVVYSLTAEISESTSKLSGSWDCNNGQYSGSLTLSPYGDDQ